ncbi:hypothetical protein ACWCXC_08300 [Streptomyces sp. NPDC001515]
MVSATPPADSGPGASAGVRTARTAPPLSVPAASRVPAGHQEVAA